MLSGGGYLPVYDASGIQTGVTDVAVVESAYTKMEKRIKALEAKSENRQP